MTRTLGLFGAAVVLVAGSAVAAELPKALVDPYLAIANALAADKFDGVAAHAKAIETAAAPLGKEASAMATGASKLAGAKDIVAARTAFGDLSSALVDYATKTKSTFPADVKVAYCPMADKPWLQKDKDIKNPYYGGAMLSCGSFKN